MKKSNQQGFGFAVILIAIVVVGIIAFGAVRVMSKSPSLADASVPKVKTVVPAKFTSTADVQKATKALDETPVDSGVNPDQLNDDLDSLL